MEQKGTEKYDTDVVTVIISSLSKTNEEIHNTHRQVCIENEQQKVKTLIVVCQVIWPRSFNIESIYSNKQYIKERRRNK